MEHGACIAIAESHLDLKRRGRLLVALQECPWGGGGEGESAIPVPMMSWKS